MSMEKQGVTRDDLVAAKDVPQQKQAQECNRPKCCRGSCGDDPVSRAADAVAAQPKK